MAAVGSTKRPPLTHGAQHVRPQDPLRSHLPPLLIGLALAGLAGCAAPPATPGRAPGAEAGRAIDPGSYEERIVLAVANDASFDELDIDAALDRRAATNIVNHRDGADNLDGTGDDDLFDSIAELDAVSYVGSSALQALLSYALSIYGEEETAAVTVLGVVEGSDEATAILYLANQLSQAELDDAVGLDRRAATNIVAARQGADGRDGTADDLPFTSLGQLDAISYVGQSAFDHLLAYAEAQGLVGADPEVDADGDGYAGSADCDDLDASVHPGAAEVCDGIDNDCDPSTSEDGLVSSDEGITYDSIAGAVWHSGSGAVIQVCAGTWTENLTIERPVTLIGRNGADRTVLDGGGSSVTVKVNASDVTIEGLTITGGNYASGGGLLQYSSRSNLVLRDLVVTGNQGGNGGGLLLYGTATLDHVSIHDNVATASGGGLGIYSAVTVTHSTIEDNFAHSKGGGIALLHTGASLTLDGVSVLDNTAGDQGGGLLIEGQVSASSTILDGNTGSAGGAAYLDSVLSVLDLDHCSVLSNTGSPGDAAVRVHYGMLSSTHTDWGKGTEENSPADLGMDVIDAYGGLASTTSYGWLGDDESFSCDHTRTSSGSCSF